MGDAIEYMEGNSNDAKERKKAHTKSWRTNGDPKWFTLQTNTNAHDEVQRRRKKKRAREKKLILIKVFVYVAVCGIAHEQFNMTTLRISIVLLAASDKMPIHR